MFRIFLIFLFSATSWSEVCEKYKNLGTLSRFPADITESSGLAVSRLFDNRFYHINDHGGENIFYITAQEDFKDTLKRVYVEGVSFFDTEDLSIGSCGETGSYEESCLFIADIGDNDKVRPYISIYVVPEKEFYNLRSDGDYKVTPLKTIKLYYPDKMPRNSESFAVHPNGDFYLLSKPGQGEESSISEMFRLSYDSWKDYRGDAPMPLMKFGEIDLQVLNPDKGKYSQMFTGMDISPKGDRFIVLSYKPVYEFFWDLSKEIIPSSNSLVKGKDFRIHKLSFLFQQEAVAYGPDDSVIFYSNEKRKGFKSAVKAAKCLE